MARHKLPTKPHKRDRRQFVAVPYEWLRHPSFRELTPDAVRVWLEMHLGFYGINNGRLSFSVRQAQICLKSGKGRAKRALDLLESAGFITCTRASDFNLKTRMAREWRLTTQPTQSQPATHDWKKNTVLE